MKPLKSNQTLYNPKTLKEIARENYRIDDKQLKQIAEK